MLTARQRSSASNLDLQPCRLREVSSGSTGDIAACPRDVLKADIQLRTLDVGERRTKQILALLLTNPACIEFDDMDTDWIPHGIIKRMLTAEAINRPDSGREQDGDG